MSMPANPPSSSGITEVAPTPDAPYTRLHITPFDPSLQNVVLNASILPRARNISFHTLQTFPDKPFGFVDLPTADADKLKKKLHGAVLKGSKMRIETARPESVPEPTHGEDDHTHKKKKSKKRKPEAGVVEGVKLEGRKVTRGWTTTEHEMIEEKRKRAKKDKKGERSTEEKQEKKDKKKEKRSRVKSKYTDEPECLFKTKLPELGESSSKAAEEDDSAIRKKRKRKSDREVVVHEFEKTVKYPTFLKSTVATSVSETTTFEDGVGWVDSTGKVVEPMKKKRRPEGIPAPDPPKRLSKPAEKPAPAPEQVDDEDDETSSSGSSSSGESEDGSDDSSSSDSEADTSAAAEQMETMAPLKPPNVNSQHLSSPSSSKPESARPKSANSVTNLSITIPPTTPPKKVHPLEALYKRPQGEDRPENNTEAQPFSFFGNSDDIEDDDSTTFNSQAPMTPFTKQEFDFRNVRSAAPTPDTAHPSRSFNFWASQGSADDAAVGEDDETGGWDHVPEAEENDDNDMEDGVDVSAERSQTSTSDFQKQFWENRGDLNRAWRRRRKAAAKDKRYRENKARAERTI